MKKLLMTMMVAVVAVTVGVSNAEAKRLGGGGSFGKQSQGMSRQAPAQSSQATNTAKPAAQQGLRQNRPAHGKAFLAAHYSAWD